MQRAIMQATAQGIAQIPKPEREAPANPLVNIYRTRDGRHLSLCMLQGQKFWSGFCLAAGRAYLASDPQFEPAAARSRNIRECVAELDALFAAHTLAEWRTVFRAASRGRGKSCSTWARSKTILRSKRTVTCRRSIMAMDVSSRW